MLKEKKVQVIGVSMDKIADQKKFKDKNNKECDWTLDGMPEAGLYPIVPVKRDWFLDKGRLHPQVKIRREQLPLMPAVAMTAHAAFALRSSCTCRGVQLPGEQRTLRSLVLPNTSLLRLLKSMPDEHK